MRTVTGTSLVSSALRLLGVYAVGETPNAAEITNGVSVLNDLIDDWATQTLTIPQNTRELFDLVVGQQTYTIGTGGDFDTVRPQAIDAISVLINPASVQSVTSITRSGSTATVTKVAHGYLSGANITISGAVQTAYNGTFIITVLTADTFTYPVVGTPTSPATGTITMQDAIGQAYEIQMAAWTYDQYVGEPVKGITSPFPTGYYYDTTFADERGQLFFWPIPNIAYQVVIYSGRILAQMDETTSVILPPAAARALRFNLAVELIPEYPREGMTDVHASVRQTAIGALANFKRSNTPLVLMDTGGGDGFWTLGRFLSGP